METQNVSTQGAPRSNLFFTDPFLCLADFESYSECQKRVDLAFRNKAQWAKMAILNTARMGSSGNFVGF